MTIAQLMEAAGDDITALPPIPDGLYAEALKVRPAVQQVVRQRFVDNDLVALVYPTVFEPAPKIGDAAEVTMAGQRVPRVMATLRSTFLAPFCSLPGLALPAGLSAGGLPIGIEFDGLPGADRPLLALGLAAEPVLGPLPAPSVPSEGYALDPVNQAASPWGDPAGSGHEFVNAGWQIVPIREAIRRGQVVNW